jgi:uncharacterized protein YfiM (DUF2279 family)
MSATHVSLLVSALLSAALSSAQRTVSGRRKLARAKTSDFGFNSSIRTEENNQMIYSYVFETAAGKVVAWFEEASDARPHAQKLNKRNGAKTHDWAHTTIRPAIS